MINEKIKTGETVIAVLKRADGTKTVIREKREESLEEKIERLNKCLKQLKLSLKKDF
ncbi:MAG: hypothetical protein ACFFCW_20745 [Candidatus Hodarchaeota archaeon]